MLSKEDVKLRMLHCEKSSYAYDRTLCISWLWYVISTTLESVGRSCHYIWIHNIVSQHRTCILSKGVIEFACGNSLEIIHVNGAFQAQVNSIAIYLDQARYI